MITIDRPHRRNAVDGPTAEALHEAYQRFEADEEARVLIVTGAGGISFCAGADLKATETMAPRLMSAEGPMGFTRLTASKPTIAAISGFCLAGGPGDRALVRPAHRHLLLASSAIPSGAGACR